MTPAGIEPATLQFVAQCLKPLCHYGPQNIPLGKGNNNSAQFSPSPLLTQLIWLYIMPSYNISYRGAVKSLA